MISDEVYLFIAVFINCCTFLYLQLLTAVCNPNVKASLCSILRPAHKSLKSVSVIHFSCELPSEHWDEMFLSGTFWQQLILTEW